MSKVQHTCNVKHQNEQFDGIKKNKFQTHASDQNIKQISNVIQSNNKNKET